MMEVSILRFPHLAEQIFLKLDDKSLVTSREVRTSWKIFLDERHYTWLHIVNIPTVLQENNTYLHLAAKTGHFKAFKMALNEEEDVNAKNYQRQTPLHLACQNGHTELIEYIMRNSNLRTGKGASIYDVR